MTAIAATSGAGLLYQLGVSKARVQQARQEASLAEQQAQTLRTQAADAEQAALQAKQRLQRLQERPGEGLAVGSASAESAPNPALQKTYTGTLAGVLALAQPLLQTANVSTPQRSVVTQSLFRATDAFFGSDQTRRQAVLHYATQAESTTTPTAERLLNATA